MPKLIVLGSNDPYWPVDALSLYWDGLPDPKLALIVPNSGHGLDDRTRVLDSLGAFSHAVAEGTPLPQLEFSFFPEEAGLRVSVRSEEAPAEARLWTAESPVRDFRDAHWPAPPYLGRLRAGRPRCPAPRLATWPCSPSSYSGWEGFPSTSPPRPG